jgi:hypothetical protein
MRSVALIVVLVAVGVSGCRQRHLIRDYGDSFEKAFAVQQARPDKTAEAVSGLDSQEAAITADNYRSGLAPKDKEVKEEPTIIVAPPAQQRREQLAPSVPKE